MLDVVKYVAAMCAPTMAVVTWLSDSADDRRERARVGELMRLQGYAEDQRR